MSVEGVVPLVPSVPSLGLGSLSDMAEVRFQNAVGVVGVELNPCRFSARDTNHKCINRRHGGHGSGVGIQNGCMRIQNLGR